MSPPATPKNFPSSGSRVGRPVPVNLGSGFGFDAGAGGPGEVVDRTAARPVRTITAAEKIASARTTPDETPLMCPASRNKTVEVLRIAGVAISKFPGSSRRAFAPSQFNIERDWVTLSDSQLASEEILRDDLEDVRVVRADREDHGALDPFHLRAEHLRSANGSAGGLEPVNWEPLLPEKDHELRELRARHLETQGSLVGLVPELLAELILVPSLAHVERALPEAARRPARDRHAVPRLEDPDVVRVLPLKRLQPLRRDLHPLLPTSKVPLDESVVL